MKRPIESLWIAVCCVVVLSGARVSAETRTWDGGGENDNWSTAGNWGGTAPVADDALVFAGTVRGTNVNDLADWTPFAGLTFNSGAGLFRLTGAPIILGGNIVNNGAAAHQINLGMELNATRTVNTASGNLILNGVLSGSGGLSKSGSSTLFLNGDSTYEGTTAINTGVIRISHPRALGSAAGGTTVASGHRLELAGGITVVDEAVTINGNGGNNNGALQTASGSNTWAGPVIIGSSGARLGVTPSNAMLTVTGVISDGATPFNLAIRNADSGGPTVIANTNAYKGETQVIVGILRLGGGDNRLPTNTVVRLGNSSNVAYAQFDLDGCNQTVAGITQEGSNMVRRITNTSTSTVATLTVNNRSLYTYSGFLSGNLNLEKTGTNRLTLTENNDFTGQVTVRDGTLQVGGAWTLQNATLNTGDGPMGVLAFDTNTVFNIGGLVGTNDLVMTNRYGAAIHLRVRGSQATAFDGRILLGSDFTKVGGGTFAMNNAATYTGRTYLMDGRLVVPTEDVLGVYPETFVQDQIVFGGGTMSFSSNFVLAASNRGITLEAGGGRFEQTDVNAELTVSKSLVGSGGLQKLGAGVLTLPVSNAYEGVTTVSRGILRVAHDHALGGASGGTVVEGGHQLELSDGIKVTDETLTIFSGGMTVTPLPPSAPQPNRGALQAGVNATAEWAGPVVLGNNAARVGAQNGGHLILSGVVEGSVAWYALQTSVNAADRTKGVELRAQNTYAGKTEIVRGVLFLGIENALPATSVLNVHWSAANNAEYAALDLNGFNQTVAGLENTGNSGGNAVVTNRSTTAVTLTVVQDINTEYNGVLAGNFSFVKGGTGTLTLTNRNAHAGTTTVSGGTLRLAVDNALPGNNAVVMSGGTLDIAGTTNTVGSLTVTAQSTLLLGGGELAVSAQTADEWTGELLLEGTLGATTLRFQPALTSGQLSRIRYDGGRVVQNAAGYIGEYYGTVILLR